ncbi:hypothetical protein ISS07_00830 [Candidatus Woesearchaeota archaeon]|nr:hypothetical protein [Candidatus Woesearchaeota archaeon]
MQEADEIDKMEKQEEAFVEPEPEFIDDESIYSERVRDQLVDDDELSAEEAGFMKGYEEAAT